MTVLYATDEKGLPLYEASRAVLKKAVPDAEVVVFTDFDGESGDAKIVNVSRYLDDSGITALWSGQPYRFPPMSAARLVSPLVPETRGLERILYLDTDTLVLKGAGLRELWSTEFREDAELAGCRDDVPPLFLARDNRRLIKIFNAVNESGALRGGDEHLVGNILRGLYINSGVTLFNMRRIVDGYGKRMDYVRSILTHHHFRFFDQDVSNALFTTQEAPAKFNDLVAGHGMVPYADTVVAHYAGGAKAKDAFYALAGKILATC